MKEIEVDSLCNGKVTDATPEEAIKRGYLADMNPIIDSYQDEWLPAVRSWARSGSGAMSLSTPGGRIISDYKDEICERPGALAASIRVSTNLADSAIRPLGTNAIEVSYESDYPIVKLKFERDGTLFKEVAIEGEKTSGTYSNAAFDFDTSFAGEHTFTVVAVDKYGYSGKSLVTVRFGSNNDSPVISISNPPDSNVSIYSDQYFNLRFTVSDANEIIANNVLLDGKLWKILGGGNSFVVPVNEARDLATGMHSILVESTDVRRAKSQATVGFEVLAR
jgi:hypothetical protein